MIVILIWWIQFFIITCALGFLTIKILSIYLPGVEHRSNFFRAFWLGFVVLITFLQFVSLFLPINYFTLLVLWLISILTILIFHKELLITLIGFKKEDTSLYLRALFVLAIAVTMLFVLFSATQDVYQADAYIYHFNAVHWISEFPAVPGLIHIHERLAFNSSFFLFAALNNIWFLHDAYYHTALSFLVVITAIQWIAVLFSKNYTWKQKLFVVSTAPFVLVAIVLSKRVSSVSTDLSTFLISLVFALELLSQDRFRYIFLAGLSACVFSFKLIGMTAIFAFMILIVFKSYKMVFKNHSVESSNIRILLASAVIFSISITGFLLRNAILSGWLLYPIPFGILNLHLPWSIPLADVIKMNEITTHFARTMSPGATMGFFEWLIPWLGKWQSHFEILLLFVSLLLILVNFSIPGIRKIVSGFKEQYIMVTLYGALSLAIWFYGGPDIRLGQVYFWIFFAIACLPVMLHTKIRTGKMPGRLTYLAIFLSITFVFLNYPHHLFARERPGLLTLKKPQFWPVAKVAVNNDRPPLEVYVPLPVRRYPWCGNSPLPCTPNAKSLVTNRVRQRVPGELSKGFMRDTAGSD
jgi:hypothetical protein